MQSTQIRTTILEKLIENGFNADVAEISTLGIVLLAYILITLVLFWVSRKFTLGLFSRISRKTKSTFDDILLVILK